MERKFPFDLSFQLAILRLMMEEEVFLVRASQHLKESYFENEYLGYFFGLIVRYFNKYQALPDETYFLNEIKRFEESIQKHYGAYYIRIRKAHIASQDYIKENLVGFIRRNMFVDMYDTMANIYSRSADDAYQYTSEKIEELQAVLFTNDIFLSFKDLPLVLSQASSETQGALKIGISKIDQALNGGLYRGDLCVLLGDTNVGKSVFLLNLLYMSITQNKKTLFLNLEGRHGQPLLRMASRATGIPYNRIVTQSFTDDVEKQRYQEVLDRYSNPEMFQIRNLHDKRFGTSLTVTIEDVYAMCLEIKKTFDFEVLIVDYGDRLDTHTRCNNRTEAQRTVYEGLDNMAKKFNVPVITASQVTRPESNDRANGWLRMRDVAEAYAKVRVAAVVMSINRSDREKLEGRVRLLLDKSRDGETNIKVGCYSNYSTLTPYDETTLGFFDIDEETND